MNSRLELLKGWKEGGIGKEKRPGSNGAKPLQRKWMRGSYRLFDVTIMQQLTWKEKGFSTGEKLRGQEITNSSRQIKARLQQGGQVRWGEGLTDGDGACEGGEKDGTAP
jgi:hypothetical protein